MQFELQDTGPCTKSLSVTIPQEAVQPKIKNAYAAVRSKADIKGFRKGKAPLELIKKRYGDKIRSEIVEDLVSEAFRELFKEHDFRLLTKPGISKLDLDEKAETMAFQADLTLYPEFELPGAEKIKLKSKEESVKDEEVEKSLESIRENSPIYVNEVERAAALDDEVIIDMEGYQGEEKLDNVTSENFSLVIGSKAMIPGFEDALVGLKTGDDKEFSLTFPEDYRYKPLAAKEVLFKIKVKAIKEKSFPELTDEFAKELQGPFQTIDELKTEIRRELEKSRGDQLFALQKGEIMDFFSTNLDFELPEVLIKSEMDRIKSQQAQGQQSDAVEGEAVEGEAAESKEAEKVEAKDEEALRKTAVDKSRGFLAVQKIAEKEDVKYTQEELDERVMELAFRWRMPFETVKQQLTDKNMLYIVTDGIIEDKVFKIIINNIKSKN